MSTPTPADKDAALLLYKQGRSMSLDHGFCTQQDGKRAATDERLRLQAEEAQRRLQQFREGAALRDAVDRLYPGWFDIDVSDVLPPGLQNAFVSNNRQEWVDWLTAHGVKLQLADELVAEAAPKAGG